jgi:hypothetical protein
LGEAIIGDLLGTRLELYPAGPLKGEFLNPVIHGNHFWFAWIVFRPESELWGA